MTLYLDTSALLPYYRSGARTDAVQRFLVERDRPVHVSPLTRAEVASVLSRWVRTGELDEPQANRIESAFHQDLASHRFRVLPIDAEAYERATHWLLTRTTTMRTLDALHLACTEAAGAALVTLDATFARAAEHLGVATVRIG